MLLDITLPLWLLGLHFIADFLLQTDWMAINKSKRLDALTLHVGVYSGVFALALGPLFGIVTFATHFATDYGTSRVARRLFPWVKTWPTDALDREYTDMEGYEGRSRHWFFCVIGFDQLIHYCTLALTYAYVQ